MRQRAHERGQTIAEFSIAVTTIFFALFGVIDFGRALYAYNLVTNSARVATRYAIVHGSNCALSGCPATSASIQAYVQSTVVGIMSPTTFVATTTWKTAPGCTDSQFQGPQCIVSVSVTYPFHFLMLQNPVLNMSSSAQMVISQ